MNSWIPCAFYFSMICHTEYFPYLICISDIDEGEDSNVWHFRKWWKDVPIGIKINLLCHREIRSVSCSVPSPVYNSRDMYTSFWWYMYYDDICKHKHITQNKCKRLQKMNNPNTNGRNMSKNTAHVHRNVPFRQGKTSILNNIEKSV